MMKTAKRLEKNEYIKMMQKGELNENFIDLRRGGVEWIYCTSYEKGGKKEKTGGYHCCEK